MKKLNLNDKQKYDLLTFCHDRILSQGKHPYHFISPISSFDVKFKTGNIVKNSANVEITYSFDYCKLRLLLVYTKVNLFDDVFNFVFIPKVLCIEREFRPEILLSIVRDPQTSYCTPIYYYQSLKSIQELCEGDFVGADAGVESAGACLVAEDVKTPAL